jgi:hypothetical protein
LQKEEFYTDEHRWKMMSTDIRVKNSQGTILSSCVFSHPLHLLQSVFICVTLFSGPSDDFCKRLRDFRDKIKLGLFSISDPSNPSSSLESLNS